MRKFGLFLLDMMALYSALLITLVIRYGDDFSYQYHIHFYPFLFIFLFWLLIFYITSLYETDFLRNNLYFFSNLFRSIAIASVISIIFFYLIPLFNITPKTNLLIFIVLFSGLVTASRTLYNKAHETAFKKPLLIVGVNPQTLELAKFIEENPQLGYRLKYIMDLAKEGIRDVNRIIKEEKINTVVIAPEAYQMPEIIDTFYRSLENKVTFRNFSSFYEGITSRIPLEAINQIWFLENLSEGSKKTYEEMKRFFDIIFAVIIGIITLPFFPVIALIIKMSSPGPIFYKQKRFGQNGKIFEIIKFRTMRTDAEKETGAVWAQENDPRITFLGRLLRKTRIDELPQIWNILRGEMSFVGPRAERPEFHDRLKESIPFYEERYIIKPGLSGWAQINYRYGASVSDAAQKLQYDLYYIKNRSLVLDLGIILKTANIAIRQAGR
jgi:exopolysaccharide biosynthesis polyprenyl glycosylphosphotransferase